MMEGVLVMAPMSCLLLTGTAVGRAPRKGAMTASTTSLTMPITPSTCRRLRLAAGDGPKITVVTVVVLDRLLAPQFSSKAERLTPAPALPPRVGSWSSHRGETRGHPPGEAGIPSQ